MKIFLMELLFILSPPEGKLGRRTSRRGSRRATHAGRSEKAHWQCEEEGVPCKRVGPARGGIFGIQEKQPETSKCKEGFTLF